MVAISPVYEEIEVGQAIPEMTRIPTKTQLVMYAGAEGDYMPLHFDHQYATESGHPSVINHGWLTYAILIQAVQAWLPPEIASIKRATARYRLPTYPGQPVVCTGRVTRKAEEDGQKILELECQAENGDGAVTTLATVVLDMA